MTSPHRRHGERLRSRSLRGKPQRGSILVLVLLMTTGLAMMASAQLRSIHTQMELARSRGDAVQAELLVESALEYALKRYSEDPTWRQNDDDRWFDLTAKGGFGVERLDDGSDPDSVHVRLTGSHGDALATNDAQINLTALNRAKPVWMDHAIVTLGGNFTIKNVTVDGDILIVDESEGVLDYDPVTQQWQPTSMTVDPDIKDKNWTVNGKVETYGMDGGSNYFNSKRSLLTAPVEMPVWDLDSYLVPDSDRIIIENSISLSGLETEKTVVVVLAPGQPLTVKDSQIGGGLVVYCEQHHDFRGDPRNVVTLNDSKIGGSDQGIGGAIGVLAPGALLKEGKKIDVRGLMHFQDIEKLKNGRITGTILSTHTLRRIEDVESALPADLYDDPIPGQVNEGFGSLVVTTLGPTYPSVDLQALRDRYFPGGGVGGGGGGFGGLVGGGGGGISGPGGGGSSGPGGGGNSGPGGGGGNSGPGGGGNSGPGGGGISGPGGGGSSGPGGD